MSFAEMLRFAGLSNLACSYLKSIVATGHCSYACWCTSIADALETWPLDSSSPDDLHIWRRLTFEVDYCTHWCDHPQANGFDGSSTATKAQRCFTFSWLGRVGFLRADLVSERPRVMQSTSGRYWGTWWASLLHFWPKRYLELLQAASNPWIYFWPSDSTAASKKTPLEASYCHGEILGPFLGLLS